MVPNGWEITNFGQLAEFRNGLNFTKADQGETIKIVGVADFKDHSTLSSFERLDTVNISNTVKENDLIKSGDVLFVRSNGNKDLIGRCLFFPEVTEKLSFSGFTIRGRVVSKDILPRYLALLSRSEIVKQQFSKNGGGTNISNLSQQILNDVVIPLPTIKEQRKIAQVLSTWDRAIATTEKLIDASKQQKKALMQQLLTGKKRLIDPETGKAFEGEWEEVKLGQCSTCLDNKRVPLNSEQRSEMKGTYPYWGANGIVDYVNEYIFDESIVLLAEDGGYFDEYATRPIANISYGKCWVNNHSHIIKGKKNATNEWLYFSLVHKNILAFINGGTRAKLNKKDMLLIKVLLPSVKEQQKITSVLFNTDKEIELLKAKLAHLKQEKKALMQQLLTGKRRVKVDEGIAA